MRLLPVLTLGTLMLPLVAHANDPHSYAQPEQVVVTHLDLDLKVDFAHRQLDGVATLKLDWKNPAAVALVLDTRDLKIASISARDARGKFTALKYALAPRDKELGSKLTITAPKHPSQVRIVYTTSPDASGLQWLTPSQTADKKAPFMFSQSESIHARSWVPLQDSPAIRFTYDAHVSAPKNIRVVMSALNDAKHPLDGDFRFDQPHPIPSYLLAIAAGDLAVKETGPRSAVYAEPSVVAKAAHEFEDTEKLIEATEKMYGPYAWGRYDILVLPPSFPFGGMENPNMTFATPTVLVGDKSLVSLVSHELAHSWSGNLVTAATWRDIWLNEGFTTYVQGRITEAVYGKSQAIEEALLSARALQKSIGEMPANSQKLAPEPHGVSADDSLSRVAYDKGSWFLRTLEQRFGRKDFDAYVKGYFSHFAWHSITTEQMLDYMKPNLIDKYPGKMS
ncbi:MAG: M1 family aminopeptidase/hydrolase, partial [Rhodanobacter sp.]